MHDQLNFFLGQCFVEHRNFIEQSVPPVAVRRLRIFGSDVQDEIVALRGAAEQAGASLFFGIQIAIYIDLQQIAGINSGYMLPLPRNHGFCLIAGDHFLRMCLELELAEFKQQAEVVVAPKFEGGTSSGVVKV